MTTFRAVGGLGNQLFVLAAAQAHHLVTGNLVEVENRRGAKGIESNGPHHRPSELDSLTLNGEAIRISRMPKAGFALIDALASLELRVKRELGLREVSKWCHTSMETGYDHAIFASSKLYYRGYFQSYKYLEFLREKGNAFQLGLQSPSTKFLQLQGQLESQTRAVLHVRRGDYSRLGATIGLLNASYYKQAAEELIRRGFSGEFVLFSDMKNLSEDEGIANLAKSLGASFIETSELDPAEVLMLMTGADAYVIANSSFSWWAASLSSPCHVIAPYPWFRVEDPPRDILHPNWKTMESSWN